MRAEFELRRVQKPKTRSRGLHQVSYIKYLEQNYRVTIPRNLIQAGLVDRATKSCDSFSGFQLPSTGIPLREVPT